MLDLHTLNREQLAAVLTTEGPLLVLAGAGSGKTRVITYRLAHLVEKGVSPKNILCVTFTNKAAFEMKERAKKLIGKSIRGATISTFHALGSKILREYGEKVGLRPGFTISDSADQMGTLRRILRQLRIDDRRFDPKLIMATIGRAKNAGLDAAKFRASNGELPGPSLGPGEELPDDEYKVATIEAYDRYEDALRAQNVVDFDDLLLLTEKLLASDQETLTKLRRRWRYLMIDEYQDTNGAQFELMRLIAGETRNLCVVGDDDQSIYGWRGADITNILRFTQRFPGAATVKLETNYRSTGHILTVANAIIEKNPHRHDKRLRPAAGPGEPIKVVAMDDEDAEADQVAAMILSLIAGGTAPRDVAVLYRSNVQSRAFELAFRRAHVPYRVVGGMDLFDKKEIKDALAYLKVLDNPEDEQSLRRILNYPPRGIGDTTVEKIDDWARKRDLTLGDGLLKVDEIPGLSPKAADAISTFMQLLAEHRKLLGKRKISTVAKKLLDAVKLEDALFQSSDSAQTSSRRVENVREILKQIERFEHHAKNDARKAAGEAPLPEPEAVASSDDDELDELLANDHGPATLSGFLSDLALSGWEDGSTKEERNDQVVLSTIHASKGLEWPHVFIVGAEEDLLPHARTVEGEGGVDEERRLAYVAVTRAREHLRVSWAQTRTRWGRIWPRKRSRFLDDLPEGAVVYEGELKVERTEEEKVAIAKEWRARIRAQLGISSEPAPDGAKPR
ncbi:UvrD-helicase domain-containing protein [Myxococcota bacterium]|nr:UvrD-helicase domain-containing protein [Myxococcota bacterium]